MRARAESRRRDRGRSPGRSRREAPSTVARHEGSKESRSTRIAASRGVASTMTAWRRSSRFVRPPIRLHGRRPADRGVVRQARLVIARARVEERVALPREVGRSGGDCDCRREEARASRRRLHSKTRMFQSGTSATTRNCRDSVAGQHAPAHAAPAQERGPLVPAPARSNRRTVASYSAGHRYGRSYESASRTPPSRRRHRQLRVQLHPPFDRRASAGICQVGHAVGIVAVHVAADARRRCRRRCGPAEAEYHAGGSQLGRRPS